MDEIIKIIFERNKERKLLSSDDVKKICYLILKKNKYDFVKQVEVFSHNPKDPTCAGVYYDENIFFFYREIIDMLEKQFDNFSDMYEIDGANVDGYNYFYLSIILHELAHVRQYAILKNKHNSLEKKIFSIFLNLSNNRDFYSDNYHDILTEINANNVSIMTANHIYSKLPKNFLTRNDWRAYQSYYLKNLLYLNYEIVDKKNQILSPAERVVNKFDEAIVFDLDMTLTECLHLIHDTKDLSLYKKLMLGLPISYMEYAYADLIDTRLGNGENINAIKKLQKKLNSTKSWYNSTSNW